MRLILIFMVLMLVNWAGAQTRDISEYQPTENINRRIDSNKKKNAPKEKKIRYIIKDKGQGLLYGNPCMLEQTRRMGFEYVVQNPGLPGSLLPWRKTLENTKVWLRLIAFRTPFWKLNLNRRVKNCRKKTGDLVG